MNQVHANTGSHDGAARLFTRRARREPGVDLFEECVAFGLEKLAKRAHVSARQCELRGHALEARRLRALAVQVVRDRRAVIVERDAGLANKVRIGRAANVLTSFDAEARRRLLNELELLELPRDIARESTLTAVLTYQRLPDSARRTA